MLQGGGEALLHVAILVNVLEFGTRGLMPVGDGGRCRGLKGNQEISRGRSETAEEDGNLVIIKGLASLRFFFVFFQEILKGIPAPSFNGKNPLCVFL